MLKIEEIQEKKSYFRDVQVNTDQQNPCNLSRFISINMYKRISHVVDLVVPTDRENKIK